MLTNVLLITLLVLLISIVVYLKKLVNDTKTIIINTIIARTKYNLEGIRKGNKEINEIIQNKFDILSSKLGNNKEILLTIRKDYIDRLEKQEKLISQLKRTQAPKGVIDTIDIVDEWLNGKPE